MDTEPFVFVGIDWASTEHQVCLTGTGDPVQRAFAHDAIGIGAAVPLQRRISGARPGSPSTPVHKGRNRGISRQPIG